mmetsp:Transcript_13771/g.27402  ORF Transcript_13771/g.27402 Transcript_13771/m.27402 type:complete len:98 (-) Transcript_13771:359-652(-)
MRDCKQVRGHNQRCWNEEGREFIFLPSYLIESVCPAFSSLLTALSFFQAYTLTRTNGSRKAEREKQRERSRDRQEEREGEWAERQMKNSSLSSFVVH